MFGREPVLWTGVIRAAVVCGAAFGLKLSTEQIVSIYALTEAILILVTRSQVSPTSSSQGGSK